MKTMFKDISDKEILDELKDLAQNENDFDNSVQWNKFNHVVQSHVDGTLYISVDKVLKFPLPSSRMKSFLGQMLLNVHQDVFSIPHLLEVEQVWRTILQHLRLAREHRLYRFL